MQIATCPECGAKSESESNCQTFFDECLVKEFTDPGYGAVHHLTVTAYYLQHSSKLSLQGWLYMRELLRDFLIVGKNPQEIRKEKREAVDSGNRNWKITAQDGKPKIAFRNWSMTIMQVQMENSEVYCGDITSWAQSVLVDCDAIAGDTINR